MDRYEFREGAGRLSLDFVRTLRFRGFPRPEEELTEPAALAAWAARFGPVPEILIGDGDQLASARRLRESVHQLITEIVPGSGHPATTRRAEAGSGAGGSSLGAAARQRINAAASVAPPAPALDHRGTVRWLTDDPVAATLSLVARDALDLASSPLIARVRRCAAPDCRMLFLDNSRPGTRRWCSMDTCGAKSKKSAYRARTS